jgi:hypothetical protein
MRVFGAKGLERGVGQASPVVMMWWIKPLWAGIEIGKRSDLTLNLRETQC